jgi:type I restriction enzyme S subunit
MKSRVVLLRQVVDINPSTKAAGSANDLVAFLAMSDISEEGRVASVQQRPLAEVQKGYTAFQAGDVLLAKITPCFENGKAALVNSLPTKSGFGSTEFHVLRPRKDVDPKFLFHLVWNHNFRRLGASRMTGSAGQKRVPVAFLSDYEFSLPSLIEQQRIATILDKAGSLRRKRRDAIRLVDDFLRAVFYEKFGDPVSNPKGLPTSRVDQLCEVATGSTPARNRAAYYDGPYPWIKTGEVDIPLIISAEEHISEAAIAETNCKLFPVGTVLIAMYGQGKTRGKVGMLGIPAATNQACAAILPSQKIDRYFLYTQLSLMYEHLRAMGRGGNQENLNLSMIKSLEVLVPPAHLVNEFLKIRQRANDISLKMYSAEADLEDMTQSLVGKYFS